MHDTWPEMTGDKLRKDSMFLHGIWQVLATHHASLHDASAGLMTINLVFIPVQRCCLGQLGPARDNVVLLYTHLAESDKASTDRDVI